MIIVNFVRSIRALRLISIPVFVGAWVGSACAQTQAQAPVTPAVQADAVSAQYCPPTSDSRSLEGVLPRLQGRIRAGGPLTIIAIGSSSTAGAGASSVDGSYPRQLLRALRVRWPGREIVVRNAGINGQEAVDMLARLDTDVLAPKPDLVIWQFGSNGLLRGVPVDAMQAAVIKGIEQIHAIGADVILMNLQRAPRIDASPARDQVLAMIRSVALDSKSALFHRYRLMSGWSDSMGDGYSQMLRDDQLHMNDLSYRCMAEVLAESLAGAARGP